MADSSTSVSITPLNNSNYSTWKSDITAVLRCKGLFRLVNGTISRPSDKPEDASQLDSYLGKLDRTAGLLILHVDKDQRVHLTGIEDDPIAMWKKLEEVHMSKEEMQAVAQGEIVVAPTGKEMMKVIFSLQTGFHCCTYICSFGG